MRRCPGLVAILMAFALLCAGPTALLASSEGGHGGEAKKGDGKDEAKIENGVLKYGPVTVNVLSNKGYKILRLAMQIQCLDNGTAERLTKPDIKEAVLFLLSTRLAEDLLPGTGKMVLRKDLLELFRKYTGHDRVKELYFTEFVLQ
jgi:flagellar FliL protein